MVNLGGHKTSKRHELADWYKRRQQKKYNKKSKTVLMDEADKGLAWITGQNLQSIWAEQEERRAKRQAEAQAESIQQSLRRLEISQVSNLVARHNHLVDKLEKVTMKKRRATQVLKMLNEMIRNVKSDNPFKDTFMHANNKSIPDEHRPKVYGLRMRRNFSLKASGIGNVMIPEKTNRGQLIVSRIIIPTSKSSVMCGLPAGEYKFDVNAQIYDYPAKETKFIPAGFDRKKIRKYIESGEKDE